MLSLGKSFASFLVFVFIISLIVLQPSLVSAQTSNSTSPPATQWQKVYGGPYSTQVSNLIQTSDGGYAFLDCGLSHQTYFFPSTLYKLDSSGNMQWNKTINLFTASNVIQTSDGGYEIAGEWNTYGTTYQTTPTVIKLNSKGDIQWYENTSTVLNLAVVSSNIQTSDGGGFAHIKQGNPNGFPSAIQPALVKTDSNNNTQWIENITYSGPLNYFNGTITFPFKIFSLIETSDGALAGLGSADPMLNTPGGEIYIIKTAPFLPLPSQSPLPTPLPSPTPAPTMITVNEQILIIALIAVVVALSIVLLTYRRHRKTIKINR
jgi:hypothetical protein